MSMTVKCPFCPTSIQIPAHAAVATCPSCLQTFRADHADAAPAPVPRVPVPEPEEEEDDESFPSWLSPWGVAAFGCAVLALLVASLVGIRLLTIALALLGVGMVPLGLRATSEDRRTRDRVWLGVGGSLSGLVLLLALFAPGILNSWWALDTAVPGGDPDMQTLIPRDQPQGEGRPLAADEWANAAMEAIRQDDAVVRLQSVKVGPLPGRDTGSYVLVHFRLANVRHDRTIDLEGFGGKHVPVLKDDAGGSCPFREQWLRRQVKGPPIFDPTVPEGVEVQPARWRDLLLVFDAPAPGVEAFRLELPASAWGRKGVYRFHIPNLFDANLPSKNK